MKILIIQNGWSGQGISGGDKHLLEVSSYWKTTEDITILLPKLGIVFVSKFFNEYLSSLNILAVPELIFTSKLANLPVLLFSYFQRTVSSVILLTISPKFDAVICSSHFFYDVLPAVMCKFVKGSKIVVYVYHLVSKQSRKLNFRNYISVWLEELSLKLIKKFADLIFTDNLQTRTELENFGIETGKLVITRVGINRPKFAPDAAKKYDLCFIGRMVKNKGVYDVLETVKTIKSNKPDVSLIFVGTGDEDEGLRRKVEEYGLLGNVNFVGSVSEKDKSLLIQESRVFVSPSVEEGWGISLAEAMSFGLPAVVYDLPVLRNIFNGGPVFVNKGDARKLAEQIFTLLTEESFYNLKSKEGKTCVSNYYLDSVASEELKVIGNYAVPNK